MTTETLICTNKPLAEVAFDLWQKMSEHDRLSFMHQIAKGSGKDPGVALIADDGRTQTVISLNALLGSELI